MKEIKTSPDQVKGSKQPKDAINLLVDLANGEISPMDHKIQSESELINFANESGYELFANDWRVVIMDFVINPYLLSNETSEIRIALQRPIKTHSKNLREWVFEICDYEGEEEWSREQDYQFRVDYILDQLPSDVPGFDQQAREGINWLPTPFGLCHTAESSQLGGILISWDKIKDLNGL